MDQGLQALVAEVEREAREEASRILVRARSAASAILEEARARGDEESRRILTATDGQIEQIRRRAHSAAQLAAQHQRQARREEILQRVFEEVRKGLPGSLTHVQRQSVLAKLIGEAARAVGERSLVVRVASADQALLTADFLEEIARSLTGLGMSIKLTAAPEPVQIVGGAIVSTDDGRASFDNSWEARLQRQMPTLRPLVWRIISRPDGHEMQTPDEPPST